MKNKYYIDENGTVRKTKPFLLFPRHNGKTFSCLKEVLPLVRTRVVRNPLYKYYNVEPIETKSWRGENAIITLDEFVGENENDRCNV